MPRTVKKRKVEDNDPAGAHSWSELEKATLRRLMKKNGPNAHSKIASTLREKFQLAIQDEQVRSRMRHEKQWYESWLQRKAGTKSEIPEIVKMELKEEDTPDGDLTPTTKTAATVPDAEQDDRILPDVFCADSPTVIVDSTHCYVLWTKTARRDVFLQLVAMGDRHALSVSTSPSPLPIEDLQSLVKIDEIRHRVDPQALRFFCALPEWITPDIAPEKVIHDTLFGYKFHAKIEARGPQHVQVAYETAMEPMCLGATIHNPLAWAQHHQQQQQHLRLGQSPTSDNIFGEIQQLAQHYPALFEVLGLDRSIGGLQSPNQRQTQSTKVEEVKTPEEYEEKKA